MGGRLRPEAHLDKVASLSRRFASILKRSYITLAHDGPRKGAIADFGGGATGSLVPTRLRNNLGGLMRTGWVGGV
jgi:hypothetical protein